MNRERTLAERVSSVDGVDVAGTFMRHAAPGRNAFAGGYGGRWGAELSVIYLGRPHDSCVEEAYRHLVDEAGVPAEYVKARILYTVEVRAANILDLRAPDALERVGLTEDDLYSESASTRTVSGSRPPPTNSSTTASSRPRPPSSATPSPCSTAASRWPNAPSSSTRRPGRSCPTGPGPSAPDCSQSATDRKHRAVNPASLGSWSRVVRPHLGPCP